MAYPKEQLHEFEELILDLHPHWWYLAGSIAALIVTFVFAVAMLGTGAPQGVLIFAAVLLLLALGWFLVRFVKWVSTDFVLTSDRVIFRQGVIAKRGIEIPLERINTIFYQQGIFERIMGLGDIEIESASKDGAQVFDDIRKPSAVQNEIYRQMEINSNRQADRVSQGINQHLGQMQQPMAPPAAAAEPTIYEHIEQLTRLRDQGMISEEEFQAKKTELLGRL